MKRLVKLITNVCLVSIVALSVSACVNYSNFYEGITAFKEQKYRDAFIRLKPEAKKGQPDAEYAVGYMYYYGQGVVENRKEAWYWITKAARAGQPDAIQAAAILAMPKTAPKHFGIKPYETNPSAPAD